MKKDNEGKTTFKRKGRPNLLSDHLMKKVKAIIIGTRAARTAINRRIGIAIGNGVVRSNNPAMLKDNGGPLELTEDWERHDR